MFQDWQHILIWTKLALAVGFVLFRSIKWLQADMAKAQSTRSVQAS